MKKEKNMTVIVGCGRVGAGIAGKLSEEKKDVIILDKDKSAFRKLSGTYGGLTMLASATDIDKLISAGVNEADTFIAVTDNDNVNICAAEIAKKLFKIPKVVARIYDEDKTALLQDMSIDSICPSSLSEKVIGNYIESGMCQS